MEIYLSSPSRVLKVQSEIPETKKWYVAVSLIQWGSEILTSLDSEWSKRGWVANGLDFCNLEAQPLVIRKNGSHLVENHLKSGKNVWISNGPVFKWLRL